MSKVKNEFPKHFHAASYVAYGCQKITLVQFHGDRQDSLTFLDESQLISACELSLKNENNKLNQILSNCKL